MKQFVLTVILFICICVSCKKTPKHIIDFYYWKTEFSLDQKEIGYLKETGATNLYIRFFDIDKEGAIPLPKGKMRPFAGSLLPVRYTPVIFITNRTFSSDRKDDLKQLAENTITLIHEICLMNDLPEYTEIQIDCDWTEKTKNAYFDFLTLLEEISGKQISCTIRLHQIKYAEKTGIPPVSKGYIMCYATSDPKENTGQNSILHMPLLKNYTENISSYPLPFAIALPLYSWGVVTNHSGNIKLINGLTEKDMDPEDFKRIGDNIYQTKKDLFLNGIYLNKGFKIRIEYISPALLEEAKNYLDKKIQKDYHIVYYHLDRKFLERFTMDELK